MTKEFDNWHAKKSGLDKHQSRVFFREREVWFASVGANIGFEQDGKGDQFLRPVVILRKFNNEICWAVPTTRREVLGKYYFPFSYKELRRTTAILSQLRLIDCKRLRYRIGALTVSDFLEMKRRLISLLE